MKKKLDLHAIKVTSFVTELEEENLDNLEGGQSCACGSQLDCLWTFYGCDAVTMKCSFDDGACTGHCCDPF